MAMATGYSGNLDHPAMQNSVVKYAEAIYNSEASKSRYAAYSRLQASAVAFGEKLPIPEIVAVGGQSDGKSSLLEALLGFRFNVREVEMGTRRPLMLQMLHDPAALEPRCRLQEEDSDDYGPVIMPASAVAEAIRVRTEDCLKMLGTAVSAKPIVMRAEYAFCPNLTIIDTPGFVLKGKKGEPENTPDEILAMVRTLAAPKHRLLLFLQQSSVEWCSSLWLDIVKSIDPSLERTIIVVSKFDNRLKEFAERWEVDRYLSAGGYLGDNARPFFVALPKDRNSSTNEDFRRQIATVDTDILRQLSENVAGGFDVEKFGKHIGFGNLRQFLEAELQRRYRHAAPETLSLLDQRCSEVTAELAAADAKISAAADVAALRHLAMIHASSVANHVVALLDGVDSPDPAAWGCTSEEERSESGFGRWPGQVEVVQPVNAGLRLYGGAAFDRVLHEFKCVACSVECPPVSKEKVASILQGQAGRRGGPLEAAFVLAQSAAREWLGPLLDTACNRLVYVLRSLYRLALERVHIERASIDAVKTITSDISMYVGFHAALRQAHDTIIREVARRSKDLVHHQLAAIINSFSEVYGCETHLYQSSREGMGSIGRVHGFHHASLSLEDSEDQLMTKSEVTDDEIHQDKKQVIGKGCVQSPVRQIGEGTGGGIAESQMTVPETPTPELAAAEARSKEFGIASGRLNGLRDAGQVNAEACGGLKRKRNRRRISGGRAAGAIGLLPSGSGNRGTSIYKEVCLLASEQFGKMREMLVERAVHTLNETFLVPLRNELGINVQLQLFAVSDEKFLDMFVAPGAIEKLEAERMALQKRCNTLHTCLAEFRTLARSL